MRASTAADRQERLRTQLPGGSPDTPFTFRAISTAAAADLFAYSANEAFYQYLEGSPFRDVEEARAYIGRLEGRIRDGYLGGDCMYWFLHDRADDRVIGTIGLVGLDLHRGNGEIGIGIDPALWGKGHMFLALKDVVEYYFGVLGMHRLIARTHEQNLNAIKLYEVAGFKTEGVLREYYLNGDGSRPSAVLLALLEREFNGRRLDTLARFSAAAFR